MAKSKRQTTEIGEKVRAGLLVSNYIRAIGDERTEVATVYSKDGAKPKLMSKAEQLARDIWKQALEAEDDKLKLEYRKLVLDRIEGKAGAQESNLPQRPSIPDKISEKGKDRLNRMVSDE